MENKKVIYADDLKTAIRDDLTIRGPAFAAVMKHINNAAAVEVAPVVHGRWEDAGKNIHGQNLTRCNKCGGASIEGGLFCRNCNAIMDLPMITDAASAALEQIGKNAHGVGGNG